MRYRYKAILAAVLSIMLLSGCAQKDDVMFESNGAESQAPAVKEMDYVVEWADPIVEQAVRRYLDRSEGDIRGSELDGISRFCVEKQDGNAFTSGGITLFIGDMENKVSVDSVLVEDAKHFRGATEMLFAGLPIEDISFLSELEGLEKLRISFCGITDIAPLRNLKKLTSLELYDNQISDLSPLSDLSMLTLLRLNGNKIEDLGALSELKSMKMLYLGDNEISDYSPLYDLPKLELLTLGANVTEEQRAECIEKMPLCSIR